MPPSSSFGFVSRMTRVWKAARSYCGAPPNGWEEEEAEAAPREAPVVCRSAAAGGVEPPLAGGKPPAMTSTVGTQGADMRRRRGGRVPGGVAPAGAREGEAGGGEARGSPGVGFRSGVPGRELALLRGLGLDELKPSSLEAPSWTLGLSSLMREISSCSTA